MKRPHPRKENNIPRRRDWSLHFSPKLVAVALTLDKMMNDHNTFFPPNLKIYGSHQDSPEIKLEKECGYRNGLLRFSRPSGLADSVLLEAGNGHAAMAS
jgi:hypothetical protein